VLHLGKILGFFYRTSIQKNKMKSRAGRVAQVVEHLISKREALTEFKLQYWKKKKKKKKRKKNLGVTSFYRGGKIAFQAKPSPSQEGNKVSLNMSQLWVADSSQMSATWRGQGVPSHPILPHATSHSGLWGKAAYRLSPPALCILAVYSDSAEPPSILVALEPQGWSGSSPEGPL
jgi:hypothetical protein